MSTNYGEEFQTARGRLYHLMSDLQWHSWRELRDVGGVRYSARLLELKRQGYEVDSCSGNSARDGRSYRLMSLTPGAPQAKRVKVFLEEQDVTNMLKGTVPTRAAKALKNALGSFRANREKL